MDVKFQWKMLTRDFKFRKKWWSEPNIPSQNQEVWVASQAYLNVIIYDSLGKFRKCFIIWSSDSTMGERFTERKREVNIQKESSLVKIIKISRLEKILNLKKTLQTIKLFAENNLFII